VSVFIDVWHRTHPLTPEAHERFLDYYGTYVVAPPSEYFEVVAGFRYTDGASNEDFALYRYASMARIEASMLSFGADPEFIAATESLFVDLELEETRAIALHMPHSPEERIDALIAEAPDESSSAGGRSAARPARRYVRSVRTCGGSERVRAFEVLAQRCERIEAAGTARLVAGFHYLVGPVMDLVEIWQLPEGEIEWPMGGTASGAGADLEAELARVAPERERRGLRPTAFSKLR
jgi:hypothetical protein